MISKFFAIACALLVGAVSADHLCPCAFISEFPGCVYPTATEGFCGTESCAGWSCVPEGSGTTTCEITETLSYVLTGSDGSCAPMLTSGITPEWSVLSNGFFCGPGCLNSFAVSLSDVSASTPAQIGSSFASITFNVFPGAEMAGAFYYQMENTAACGGGSNEIAAMHVHIKNAGSQTGPVAFTICGNPGGQMCPPGLQGTSGTYLTAFNGDPANAAAAIDNLTNNPSEYYVNLHTACAPGGLIRGEFA
mmetsp:Transcript_2116/g.3733  ORF Transcript_2116/g.3733 Transcript_2116/m.3733 type:complete len:249 (-) Transcript_2116:222-968(-)